ncbi:hypothetical protein CV102_18130 [Natronococcus pandeyae]|uniref:Glycosyl transferase family 1 domain-containing protein n=1 Tax=Natronococcus pandeyae TaxID=2055836 RepID=A0A8J8Q2I0_9EURY|nr:glycosyltransferase family 4 protein [Natronococcus pandeyae]TYL37233.1 hypothetical protein CV102_18130 [Natronococcus pandeyae]
MNLESIKLLIVGGSGGRTGGTGIFVAEQKRNLEDIITVDVFPAGIGYAIDSKLSFLIGFFLSIIRLAKFPFQEKPDIVHINTSSSWGFYRNSFYVLFSYYVWECPVVIYTRGSGFDEFIRPNNRFDYYFKYLVLNSSDKILTLTDVQKKATEQYVSCKKAQVHRQCTEVEKYSPTYNQDQVHVLFLSNFHKRKGVSETVDAIDNLLQSSSTNSVNLEISFAGDGKYKSEIIELSQRHDCVEYHGFVTGEEKISLINNSTIFLLPTYSEGFPSAIIEAMAGGNAIITTDVSGIPEVIIDGKNGMIIEPRNSEDILEALEHLITSPDNVLEMAKRNRKDAVSNHDWETMTQSLLGLYIYLLSNRS